MIIIIGLGNPGEEFKKTRHNVGFLSIDAFAAQEDFPEFELEKKFDSLVSKKGNMLLAKPQTFMNASGRAAKKLATMHKKAEFVAVHDDLDLPLGKIKISINRGSAGHKGVESVMKAVGKNRLIRLRVGIQPNNGKPKNSEKFVIGTFSPAEQALIKKAIKKVTGALAVIVKEDVERAMNEFNR